MLDEETKKLLYNACRDNDYTTFRENVIVSQINTPLDDNGNTALHIAALHARANIILLLLRYHADSAVLNNEGKTPIEMTLDDEIQKIFQTAIRPPTKSADKRFVADEMEVEPIEWLDSYRNAYRISYENHEHLRRWVTKVPLKKLLEEIKNGYTDKMTFPAEATRAEVKGYMECAIDDEDPLALGQLYTGTTMLCTQLNHDLAELGSDFRFVSTRLDYPDNEPPKDLGQHIYASLLINHPRFRCYQYASTTFRGMRISSQDLQAYGMGKIIITRSFLSTSKNREVAEVFIGFEDVINHPPVICIYHVSNPRSSLSIEEFSKFPEEKEVLIVPFIAFEITAVREVSFKNEGIEHVLREIELVECVPNPR